MTKGKQILSRVDAYFLARAREAEEQKEAEAAASAAALRAAQQREMQRMRAAQFRQNRSRKRLTVGEVRARQEQERRKRMLRQQSAAAELRARAQARRDARMLVEAFEANRRHEIDRIIARRTNMQTREYDYLIRWRGLGSEADQWRPRSALVADGVGSMLDEFDATQVSASSAAFGPGGFSKALTSNGIHDSSRRELTARNDTSVAAADSSSSSGSDVSSDSDSMYSMDSADDDDDEDDDSWQAPPNIGARVSRDDDGASTRLCAPSLLRRLHNESHLFEGVHSASSLRF